MALRSLSDMASNFSGKYPKTMYFINSSLFPVT
jgi:hypothetical protein